MSLVSVNEFRLLSDDFPAAQLRTDLAYPARMAQVLIGVGAWFVTALVVGVALGKMIAAADRAAQAEPPAHVPDAHRAA